LPDFLRIILAPASLRATLSYDDKGEKHPIGFHMVLIAITLVSKKQLEKFKKLDHSEKMKHLIKMEKK